MASCYGPANKSSGAYLALYSERDIDGRTERFCNLAAWCVMDEYRSFGLMLLKALLTKTATISLICHRVDM